MNTHKKGNIGLAAAISYFVGKEQVVSLPMSASCPYDLIADDGEKLNKIQCKYTTQRSPSGIPVVGVRIITSWGPDNKQYRKRYKDGDFDLFFVLCDNGDRYIIPFGDMSSARSSINLGNKWDKFKIK